jgi:hypothetical protein
MSVSVDVYGPELVNYIIDQQLYMVFHGSNSLGDSATEQQDLQQR